MTYGAVIVRESLYDIIDIEFNREKFADESAAIMFVLPLPVRMPDYYTLWDEMIGAAGGEVDDLFVCPPSVINHPWGHFGLPTVRFPLWLRLKRIM